MTSFTPNAIFGNRHFLASRIIWITVVMMISIPAVWSAYLLNQMQLARHTGETDLVWGILLGVPALSVCGFIAGVRGLFCFAGKRTREGFEMLGVALLAAVSLLVTLCFYLKDVDTGLLIKG